MAKKPKTKEELKSAEEKINEAVEAKKKERAEAKRKEQEEVAKVDIEKFAPYLKELQAAILPYKLSVELFIRETRMQGILNTTLTEEFVQQSLDFQGQMGSLNQALTQLPGIVEELQKIKKKAKEL